MIIKKIEILGKKVKVNLDDGTDFTILLETYLNNHILIDNEISKEEISRLKNKDKPTQAKLSLINKISKRRLSKIECEKFLKELEIDVIDAYKIIKELENNYLINDNDLAESIISACVFNKKGINKIKDKLNERGINSNWDELIETYLDREKYNLNIVYQLEKYSKIAKNKSKKELKKYLNAKMIENGFIKEDFIDLIDNYDIDEKEGIIKEINQFFKKKEVNRENIAKITKKLLSKGFNYDIIRDVIRECELNETY